MPTISEKKATIKKWLGTGSINVFGRPFAGKDLQSRRLARWLDSPGVLGGGDILRKRDDLPPRVKEALRAGLLVPVQDYLNIVTPYLAQADFEGRPLVLSSVGRYFGEETNVVEAAARAGHPIQVVIDLEINESTALDRMHKAEELMDRGDRPEAQEVSALRVRFKEFETKTQPVLEFYQTKGLLVTLDGGKSPDEVEDLIINALYERASSQPA